MADGTRRREILAGLSALAVSVYGGCAEGGTETDPDNVGQSSRPAGTGAGDTRSAESDGGDARTATTDRLTYERATVVAYDDNGTRLAAVDVRIADTYEKRYVGLSETASLAPDEGMLFVHDREGRHAYVMRGMAFPLDVVFLDANGTVTRIYHADEDGAEAPYRGQGKYVLEVNRGWTNRTGLDVGDSVAVPP